MVGKGMGSTRSSRSPHWNNDWGFARNYFLHLARYSRTFEMKSFLKTSFLVNLGVYAIGRLIPGFEDFASTWIWGVLIAGYAGLTLFLFGWTLRASKKSPVQFVTAVNGATALKMLVSLAVVTTYLVTVGGAYRIPFSLGLFVAFSVNTFLLVAASQKINQG